MRDRSTARSPYVFVGTVIDTAKDNRVATVITDEGEQVTVVSTPGFGPDGFRSGARSIHRPRPSP